MSNFNFKSLNSLVRLYTLPMSFFPFLIGYFASCSKIGFTGINPLAENGLPMYINAIIALVGVLCAHMFANLFDDYIDIKSQLDFGIQLNEINFKSKRKARAILNGDFSIQEVEKILIILGLIAFFTALYFVYTADFFVLLYVIPAAVLTVFYPVSSRFGLSEFVIGLIFGPLLINGVFYALTSDINSTISAISIASGLMTSILAITQGVMDYEFDKPSGKKSIAVILGSKKKTIILISALICISYIIMTHVFAFTTILEALYFILPIGLTLPIGIKLLSSLDEYINIKDVKFIPKWYLGPMENWNFIKENGFEYYMFRFYLARNLAIFFNLGVVLSILLVMILSPVFLFLKFLNF